MLITLWVRSYFFVSRPCAASYPRITILSWKGVLTVIPGWVGPNSVGSPREFFRVSYLPIVLLFALFAGLPWVTWYRYFSLRAFLITATFVALAMGAVMAFR
jgi:hypothetical protein